MSTVGRLAIIGGTGLASLEGLEITGREVVSTRFGEASAPVVHGQYVVVGDFEGYLHWLSREDGRFVARTQVADGAITTPPVAVGETLYVYSDDGTVAAVQVGER